MAVKPSTYMARAMAKTVTKSLRDGYRDVRVTTIKRVVCDRSISRAQGRSQMKMVLAWPATAILGVGRTGGPSSAPSGNRGATTGGEMVSATPPTSTESEKVAVPKGRSKLIQYLLNKKEIVFMSLDTEHAREETGIVQLLA